MNPDHHPSTLFDPEILIEKGISDLEDLHQVAEPQAEPHLDGIYSTALENPQNLNELIEKSPLLDALLLVMNTKLAAKDLIIRLLSDEQENLSTDLLLTQLSPEAVAKGGLDFHRNLDAAVEGFNVGLRSYKKNQEDQQTYEQMRQSLR